jgi:membrane peptidoglycan carboxypeptidase
MGIEQQTLRGILTMTLGAIESTPLEMASVASTIAAHGVHHPPLFVDRIEGPNGEVVFDGKNVPGTRAISSEAADCEADLMKGVITSGTGNPNAVLANGRDAAGKTGTTDDKRNAAFLGFTPQLAAFVWHGSLEDNKPGAGFGGNFPARMWKLFMDRALEGQFALPLPDPGPACARAGARITPLGRVAGPIPGVNDTVPTTAPPTVVVQRTTPREPAPTSPCIAHPDLNGCPGTPGGNGNGNGNGGGPPAP